MIGKSKQNRLSFLMYIFAFLVFCSECILSTGGISPYLRIAFFLFTMAFLWVGSAIRIKNKAEAQKQKIMRKTMWVLFFLYLLLFFSLVFVDSYSKNDIRADVANRAMSFSQYKENYLSLVPFRSTGGLLYSLSRGWIDYEEPLINIAGNFLLCMPFAFFLPILFRNQRKFFVFGITVFAISFFVESIQLLFRIGFCDIDDLMLNVCGGCIFFFSLRIKSVRKLINKITNLEY